MNEPRALIEGDQTISAGALLGRPVRHRGVTLGRVADVIASRSLEQVLGLEVLRRTDGASFLPWAVCEPGAGEVDVVQPASLLTRSELDFYRRVGRTLREARRTGRSGRPAVRDLLLRPDGSVAAIVLAAQAPADAVAAAAAS